MQACVGGHCLLTFSSNNSGTFEFWAYFTAWCDVASASDRVQLQFLDCGEGNEMNGDDISEDMWETVGEYYVSKAFNMTNEKSDIMG